MPAPIKTYRPKDIRLIINGYVVGGIVNIGVAFPTERMKEIKGIRGQNTRVSNKDTGCTISVEVLQTSVSNDFFSSLLIQDQLKQTARLSVKLQDLSGTTNIVSDNAFVNSYADFQFSLDINNKTWQITLLDSYAPMVGGNTKAKPQFLEEAASFVQDTITNILN